MAYFLELELVSLTWLIVTKGILKKEINLIHFSILLSDHLISTVNEN